MASLATCEVCGVKFFYIKKGHARRFCMKCATQRRLNQWAESTNWDRLRTVPLQMRGDR